jgi:hypothetical protein
MQTNGLFWYLVFLDQDSIIDQTKGTKQMSKTASLRFAPPESIFSRLLAAIDRFLMTNAKIAIRNGDLPYFGL